MAVKIGFVCDSTADFPAGMVQELGLHILPVHIVISGRDYLHGVAISNADVLTSLKKKDIFTKPFYPGECADLYERLLRRYDHLLSFHLSPHLSHCYKSARTALTLMREEDARRVTVLNLESVSVSLGLIVKSIVEYLRKGGNPRALPKKIAQDKSRLFMTFTVQNLHWLKKGGRISALAAFVGRLLSIKPVIALDNARLIPLEKHRGKGHALKRMIEITADAYRASPTECEIWVAYAGNLDEVIHMREKLAVALNFPSDAIKLVEIGATILVHGGPGTVAIAMAPK